MEKNNDIWSSVGAIALAIVIGLGLYGYFSAPSATNPTINVKTDTTIRATVVQVGTFYDGQDGYSLSVPSGNSSTCIWTYAGGSAAVPYSETTYAQTATQKHTLHYYPGSNYDFKVSCVDDFGNQYIGSFPEDE